jgi:hypothetical protein
MKPPFAKVTIALLKMPALSTNCDHVVDHGSSTPTKAIPQKIAQLTRFGRHCQSTLDPSTAANGSQSKINAACPVYLPSNLSIAWLLQVRRESLLEA